MTFGLTHVFVPVEDLAIARAFYVDGLGFSVVAEAKGNVDLEAGLTVIRLTEVPGRASHVTLRLQTASVDDVIEKLMALGTTAVPEPVRSSELELLAEVDDPDRNRLIFWRRLSEDEYDRPPALPTTRAWEAEAQTLMQALLTRVPTLFRDVARSGAVAEAEHLAVDDDAVGIEAVVRAYIRATPRLLRSRVREPLTDHGFDPDQYHSDFEV